ncbi:hypothetical protein OIV83_002333 [Microbotryomycetes sp. JL201]|nr:hypothetical protein OIV83_002333 [Microbotryomycetes sp. JL201]
MPAYAPNRYYGDAVGQLHGMSAYSHSRTSPVVEFGVDQSTFSSDEGHTPPPSTTKRFLGSSHPSPKSKPERPSHTSRPSIRSLRQLFGHVSPSSSAVPAADKLAHGHSKGTVSKINVQVNSPRLDVQDARFAASPSPVSPRSKPSAHSIRKKTSGMFKKRASSSAQASPVTGEHPEFGSFATSLNGGTTSIPAAARDDHGSSGTIFKALIHRPSVDAAFGMNDPTLPVRRKSFSKPDLDRLHSPLPPVPPELGSHLEGDSLSMVRSVSADLSRRPVSQSLDAGRPSDRRSQSLNRRSKRVSAGAEILPGAFDIEKSDRRRKHSSLGAYAGPEGAIALRDDLAFRSLSISSSPVLDGSTNSTRRPSPTRTASNVSVGSKKVDANGRDDENTRPRSRNKAHGSSALAHYLQNSVRPISQVGGEPRSLRPIVIPAANSNRLSAASPIPHRRTASAGSASARLSQEICQSRSGSPTANAVLARPGSVGASVGGSHRRHSLDNLETATTAPLRLSGSSNTLTAVAGTGAKLVMGSDSREDISPVTGTPIRHDSVIDVYGFSPHPQESEMTGQFSIVHDADESGHQPRRRSLAGPVYPTARVSSSSRQDQTSSTVQQVAPPLLRRRSSASLHISNPPSRKQSSSDLVQGQADSPFEVDSFYELYEKDRRERKRSLKRQSSRTKSQDLGDQLEAMLARPEDGPGRDEWRRISIAEGGVVDDSPTIASEGVRHELAASNVDDDEDNVNEEDEAVENQEGEETIKFSALSSPQQPESSAHSSPLANYYKDSPVQEDVRFHDDDDDGEEVEVLHDQSVDRRQGRAMTVEEMESEISRMEAELSLSGRHADLEAIRHESMKSLSEAPTGSQSSAGLQRSNSTGSTLSLGALTRKWSIVEMERAYERMRGMLGSTRSFCLSEMDVESGAEDNYDLALREDKLYGASNVALADANDEEVMALPSNRFLTPKPLDASTFSPIGTEEASAVPDETSEPSSGSQTSPLDAVAIREDRIEPKVEELPVSTESPVAPVKTEAVLVDWNAGRRNSQEPVLQPFLQERSISPTQQAPTSEVAEQPRKESLASSVDPESATSTDPRASIRTSGDLSSAVTNPTEVSVPTAMSLKQYGTERETALPYAASAQHTAPGSEDDCDRTHTPQLSPRSSLQQQRQRSVAHDQTETAIIKSPASLRASSRLSSNSLRSGAGRDLQRWLAGEPRREADLDDRHLPASPTHSTRGRDSSSSRTGIRPLLTMSPDRESLAEVRSDSGSLSSPRKSTFTSSFKGKRSTISNSETLSSTRLTPGTWFPETPARAGVRRANLRHSLDPRDVFGHGTSARGVAKAVAGDPEAGSVKASSEVGEASSEVTIKPRESSLHVAGIRNMDKLEIFFKFTAAKADLEKAELERDALFDALQESRSTLADVRSQRECFKSKLDEERKLYKHLIKYLGDDTDEQIQTLREFVSGRNSWENQAKQAVSQLERMKDEMDLLRRELAECRSREGELERELIVLGAQVASRSKSLGQSATDSGATRTKIRVRREPRASDESELVFDHTSTAKVDEQGTPLLDQTMAFGAKRSVDSVGSPLQSRSAARRGSRSERVSRSILPIILPVNEQQHQPSADVQRDSVISSSTATDEDGSVGEHLPPRPERNWNHVRHGSTASAMLKLDAADEKFLRDLSHDERSESESE